MEHFRRADRLPVLMQKLSSAPNRLHTLTKLCGPFDAGKSTLSEDVNIISKMMTRFGMGTITTVPGAAGGVRFRPDVSGEERAELMHSLCEELQKPERILPGGYLYLSDVLSIPDIVRKMGIIIAAAFYESSPDLVLTMETKGIPVAMMTAQSLNVPLAIARRSSKVYEGPAVNINYISGSHGNIETMSLNRRAVQQGQRVLIVDDFIRGGGTAKGMINLMMEFSADVVGAAFVMASADDADRQIGNEKSLMVIQTAPEGGFTISPTEWALG